MLAVPYGGNMKDKTLLYIAIAMLAIAILTVTISSMAYHYPSRGYYYGQNLDVGSNMPVKILKEIK
jgi:hypothetical protein